MKTLLIMTVLFFLNSLSFAESSEHSTSMNITELIGSFFNFALFLFAIIFFAQKTLGTALSERSKAIAKDIHNAEEKLKKAEESLQRWNERLNNIENERKNIEKSFLEKAERISSEMQTEFVSYCHRFQRNLESRIERENEFMKSTLKQAVTEQALKIALEKMKQNSHEKSHALWFDSFINNIQSGSSQKEPI